MMEHEETENRAEKPVTTSEAGAPEERAEGRGVDRVTLMGEERPQETRSLVEALVSKENMERAYRQVVSNQGSAGVDGMEVEELKTHLKTSWEEIKASLLSGTYRPGALRKVMIPKANGGERMLGIPTVTDRLISRIMERTPGDWRLHRLIHRYLKTGILEGGLVSQREKGTPQGSPVSPLLSNIVLDELDKELERRGHSFVRYADDCNIYVKSEKSAQRVLESVSKYLEGKLRLKVNREKSKVRKASFSKFLGFSF